MESDGDTKQCSFDEQRQPSTYTGLREIPVFEVTSSSFFSAEDKAELTQAG